MTSKWLTNCIVATVSTIAVMSVVWSGSCVISSFISNPLAETESCKNHDDRAIQVMMALLATLISLKSNPPMED